MNNGCGSINPVNRLALYKKRNVASENKKQLMKIRGERRRKEARDEEHVKQRGAFENQENCEQTRKVSKKELLDEYVRKKRSAVVVMRKPIFKPGGVYVDQNPIFPECTKNAKVVIGSLTERNVEQIVRPRQENRLVEGVKKSSITAAVVSYKSSSSARKKSSVASFSPNNFAFHISSPSVKSNEDSPVAEDVFNTPVSVLSCSPEVSSVASSLASAIAMYLEEPTNKEIATPQVTEIERPSSKCSLEAGKKCRKCSVVRTMARLHGGY